MYCDVDDLIRYLGLQEQTDSDLLQWAIEAAQKYIDARTGRTFEASADTTRYFDAEMDVDGNMLNLDSDLCAITMVTNGDGVIVSPSQYVTNPRNKAPYYSLQLRGGSGVYWSHANNGDPINAISITGRWAYSVVAPYDIAQAALRLARWFYQQKDNAGDADRALVVGNSTILPSRIPADAVELIDPYVRRT